ncbi:MAG: hypothetical protein A2096_13190 [Spirochaetes bacterium GWF1_41_5]|nr:MAG: hypothetical protein A2096_13190 [Spirochaetes bacterium GWF1_41_5]
MAVIHFCSHNLHLEKIHSTPSHYHEFWQLDWLKSGQHIAEIDKKKIRIRPGDLLLIRPYTEHIIHYPVPSVISTVKFSLDDNYLVRRKYFLSKLCTGKKHLLKKFYHEYVGTHCRREYIAGCYIDILIIKYFLGCSPAALRDRLMETALEYMHGHLAAADNASIAEHCGITVNHLVRRFRRYYGETPGRILLSRKMHHARRLIRSGLKGIREIAEQCGYNDEFAFSKAFKKNTGLSPSKYRNLKFH